MTTYNPFNDKNRLFLEDVMSLDTNTHILLLIPKKMVDNDINLTKIKDFLSPYTTQLSSKSPKLYYLFPASTVSCNQLSNNSEIDTIQDLSTKGYTIMLESYTSKLKHEHFISWEDILMGKDTGIQVWSEVTELRDCKVNFFNKYKRENELEKLLHWIYLELYGDEFQIFFTVSRYYAAIIRKKQYLLSLTNKNTIQINDIYLNGPTFKEVLTQIDTTFKDVIQKCYTTFCIISQPILSTKTINELIDLYMLKLPQHYNLMKTLLGYDKKEKMTKNLHLTKTGYYNKILFYQFLMQSRVRDPHNCIHWAMISAAAAYGRGASTINSYTSSSCFFAHSTRIKTFLLKTKEWRDNMETTLNKKLSHIKNFMCCLDNNQKGHPLKYQRFGSSNKFVKVTGFIVKEFICDDLLLDQRMKCDISYINQKIPSAFLMPHYESLYENENIKSINEYNLLNAILDITTCSEHTRKMVNLYPNRYSDHIDYTGRRVSAYMIICNNVLILDLIRQVCGNIYTKQDKRFRFVNHLSTDFQTVNIKSIISKLANIKKDILSKKTSTFQSKVTEIWNPLYNNVSKLIIPPVSLHDEIKTDGYGMALIELLTTVGIIDKLSVISGDKVNSRWELSNNWKEKNLYLCLDGLSLDRHRSFNKKLLKMPLSFTNAFQQSQVFHKALSRVVEISGPLHMAFHILQSIYIIYKDLLQWAQTSIEWKKLKPTKVSDNFRLSESLCLMLYEEIFRSLFFRYMKESEKEHNGFIYINDENLIAVKLSKGFMQYIDEKVITTTDDRLKYQIYFFKLTHLFKSYKEAINAGDTVCLEYLEALFCPVFLMLEKSNYVEVVLSQIERKYGNISYQQLHDIRINSVYRYYKNNSERRYPMHAMDSIMENVNMYVKQLPLDSSEESWIAHSPNVMVARRSINFVEQEYRRGLLDFEQAIDDDALPQYNSQTHTQYIEPRKNVERSRLFEFVSKYFDGETDKRKVSHKVAMNIIKNLKTTLMKPNANQVSKTLSNLQNIIEDINHLIEENAGMETQNESNSTSIEHLFMTTDGLDDEVDNCDNPSDIIDENNLKNDCNKWAIVDIIEIGKEHMRSKNIPKIRLRRKQRNRRHDIFMCGIYDNITKDNNSVQQSLNKLLVSTPPSIIPLYTRQYRVSN